MRVVRKRFERERGREGRRKGESIERRKKERERERGRSRERDIPMARCCKNITTGIPTFKIKSGFEGKEKKEEEKTSQVSMRMRTE